MPPDPDCFIVPDVGGSMEGRYLWGLAGLLSYLAAALLLAMAVTPMFDASGTDAIIPDIETAGLLVISILLFGLGGICLRRATLGTPTGGGAGTRTTRSTPQNDDTQNDGEARICPECGTANDPFYRYCGVCASEL